jgi:hypothetical protein
MSKTVLLNSHPVPSALQVEFLPQCDKVAIMDQGDMIYFGPWNERAQHLLSQVLPTSHLLAAAGSAEERKTAPKKPKATATSSTLNLSATNVKDNMGKKAIKPTSLTLAEALSTYVKFCGPLLMLVSLFFFLSAQTSRQLSDVWVRRWTGDTQKWYSGVNKPLMGMAAGESYLTIYALLTFAFIFLMVCRPW